MVEPVHFLPIATTLLSAAFVIALLTRASKRNWAPHLMWWAIGIFFYGVGTAIESTITLAGNTETLNRVWYWAGAILGGYPLGTGSLYLLARRRVAHVLTAISLAFVIVASVLVFIGPMKVELLEAHRPTGRGIWEWSWLPWMTPFINIYALIFLVGGALFSCVRFAMSGTNAGRALGTGLIATGAMLPAVGGAMTKAGYVEALYVGEFIGLVLIVIGYWVCLKSPPPQPALDARSPVTT
jgi:hypothetical protein